MNIPSFEELQPGYFFSFERTLESSDETLFAQLSGDTSILDAERLPEQFAGRGRVVHGMLAASLFSALVDMHCPGPECLYLHQTLRFLKPIFFGETLIVRGTITGKSESTRMLTIKTEIARGDEIVLDGEARVLVLKPQR